MPSVTCHLSSAPRGVARITHVHTHVASLRGVRCKLRSITCHVSRWYGTDLTSTAYVVHAENYDTRTPESHVHQAEVRPFTQFIWVATSGALHDVAPGTYPSQRRAVRPAVVYSPPGAECTEHQPWLSPGLSVPRPLHGGVRGFGYCQLLQGDPFELAQHRREIRQYPHSRPC